MSYWRLTRWLVQRDEGWNDELYQLGLGLSCYSLGRARRGLRWGYCKMGMVEWGRLWRNTDDLVSVRPLSGSIWERIVSWKRKLSFVVIVMLF